MIKSFSHKELERLFTYGKSKINPSYQGKINKILGKINSAGDLRDLNSPGHRLHKHKGKDGIYSIDVSGNYRILFKWNDGHAWDVSYEDPH